MGGWIFEKCQPSKMNEMILAQLCKPVGRFQIAKGHIWQLKEKWKPIGSHSSVLWETSRRQGENNWDTTGKQLGDQWKTTKKKWNLGGNWETTSRKPHLGDRQLGVVETTPSSEACRNPAHT